MIFFDIILESFYYSTFQVKVLHPHLWNKIFTSLKNKVSDVNKNYIGVHNGQKFELQFHDFFSYNFWNFLSLYFLGKSITPPPGFDEAASEQDPSLSRSTTLKSPNKLKSMLSIGKKVWLIHGFYLFFFYPFIVTICVNKVWEWPT